MRVGEAVITITILSTIGNQPQPRRLCLEYTVAARNDGWHLSKIPKNYRSDKIHRIIRLRESNVQMFKHLTTGESLLTVTQHTALLVTLIAPAKCN